MADRPILFSAPMVRALLAGTKTQTRRPVKPQPKLAPHHEPVRVELRGDRTWVWMVCTDRPTYQFATGDWKAPFAVGDRLWVRENGWQRPERTDQMLRDGADTWERYYFDADLDEHDHADLKAWGFKRRPSIHMPRWASRLTLHVIDVRVERLQDISEADALAEGISYDPPHVFTVMDDQHQKAYAGDTAKDCYADLWDGINGAGSWDKNPWVAAYTFTVERTNIDQARAAA